MFRAVFLLATPALSGDPGRLTQDGHHHVLLEDLDGAARDEVERGEHVAAVHQRVTGGRVGGLEPHGQGAEAAVGGAVEGLAALQQALVEVEADVGLQALRETLQHLGVRTQGQSGRTEAGRGRGRGGVSTCTGASGRVRKASRNFCFLAARVAGRIVGNPGEN